MSQVNIPAQSFTICDYCGGQIPDGADRVGITAGSQTLEGQPTPFSGLDFCCTEHVTLWTAQDVPQVPTPSPLYSAPSGFPPRVTNMSPSAGPVAGGTTVTFTGTGFTGVTEVDFGGVAATGLTVVSDTQLTCVTPAVVAGPAAVTIISPTGTTSVAQQFVFS